MPEGDTIHHAANRIRPVLAGRVPDEIATPHPRFGKDRWPERLGRARSWSGRRARQAPVHALRRADLVIHSHLRMTAGGACSPRVSAGGARPRRAWLVLRAGGHEVVAVRRPGPGADDRGRGARFDQRLAAPRPRHPRRPSSTTRPLPARACARTTRRARSATRCSTSAPSPGSGTIWKTEGCFAAAVDPWRETRQGQRRRGDGRDRRASGRGWPQSRRDGFDRTAASRSTATRAQPCPRCGARDPVARPGRRQPSDILVPGCQT